MIVTGSRSQSLHVPVLDSSRVSEARRAIGMLAGELRLSEADAGRAQIVASELANNLLRHARDGFLVARALQDSEGRGLEIAAIDRGPGMDLERCLTDGFSTGGTPGTGLGAVRRLSDSFDAYSLPSGSIAVARVLAERRGAPAHRGTGASDRRDLSAQERRRDVGRCLGRHDDGGRPDAGHRRRWSWPRAAGRRRQHRRAGRVQRRGAFGAGTGRHPRPRSTAACAARAAPRWPSPRSRRRAKRFDSLASATWRRW